MIVTRWFVTCAACTLSVACSTPRDYGVPLAPEEHPPWLPVFVMDASDAERNPIQAVFVSSINDGSGQRATMEVTVIFADESPPFLGIQTLFLSEPIRRLCYGRWQDVESLRYEYRENKTDGEISSIAFDGTFAGCQAYDALWPHHPSATIPIGTFEREDRRPVIYVTTWNHLFHWGPRDLAGRKVRRVREYCVYRGTRADVDALW